MLSPQSLPLSRYVYGTTRLGDDSIPFADRVAVARKAIDAGLALHTSDQYGSALKVLKAALDEDRSKVPNFIFKVGWESVDQVRSQIESQLEAVGMDQMAVGQLCLAGLLAEDFRRGGRQIEALNALKSKGLVGQFVLECWPWTSDVPYMALESGHAHRLIDGLIFYLNPLQRFVLNDLWDWIVAHGTPVVAMRTVAGGSLERLCSNPESPKYLRQRAGQMSPVYEKSGCSSWTEFCVRFALGMPLVSATVGATAKPENLDELLKESKDPRPLDPQTMTAILELQRQWSNDHDRLAEPWSM